jgi:membrane protease YdiL (CAAX protease family)
MTVNPSGWVFLITTCIFLPGFAIWSATRPRQVAAIQFRAVHLVSVFVTQSMTLLLALSAAGYNAITLFTPPHFSLINLIIVAAFLVSTLGTLPVRWAWKTKPEKQQLLGLLPHSPRDLGWWAGVALAAGIIEEIVYRGVMFTLWQRVVGFRLALVICVGVFTLVHIVQGWRAMAAIALIALAAHLIVLITGDLYTAMIVHVLYDLIAGVVLLQLALRDRLLPVNT